MFRSALIVYVQYVSQERLFLFNRRYLPDPTQVGRIYALAGHCPKVSLTRTAKDPSAHGPLNGPHGVPHGSVHGQRQPSTQAFSSRSFDSTWCEMS